MNIKKTLISALIKAAIKKNPNAKVSPEQKRKLEDLTLLFVNKGISKEQYESEMNRTLKS